MDSFIAKYNTADAEHDWSQSIRKLINSIGVGLDMGSTMIIGIQTTAGTILNNILVHLAKGIINKCKTIGNGKIVSGFIPSVIRMMFPGELAERCLDRSFSYKSRFTYFFQFGEMSAQEASHLILDINVMRRLLLESGVSNPNLLDIVALTAIIEVVATDIVKVAGEEASSDNWDLIRNVDLYEACMEPNIKQLFVF
jgi:hypothetical protein